MGSIKSSCSITYPVLGLMLLLWATSSYCCNFSDPACYPCFSVTACSARRFQGPEMISAWLVLSSQILRTSQTHVFIALQDITTAHLLASSICCLENLADNCIWKSKYHNRGALVAIIAMLAYSQNLAVIVNNRPQGIDNAVTGSQQQLTQRTAQMMA